LSINIETFGTGRIPDTEILRAIREHFDLRPGAIIRDLGLRRPIFLPTAAYGHFGRDDIDLPWERLNRLEEIKASIGSVKAII
jgi:S-adenosylmethionine synthetase